MGDAPSRAAQLRAVLLAGLQKHPGAGTALVTLLELRLGPISAVPCCSD